MKKILIFIFSIISLLTSCSPNYVFSEYKGYEYVINEGKDLYKTYSFFGEKAISILKDEVKKEYAESIFYVISFDELERVTNTNKLKNILGNDIFSSYYLAICQRSDEYDSIYSLNCAYQPILKIQSTYSGDGWVDSSDMYLEVNRYFTNRKNDPEIVNDYVLDIIIMPKVKTDYYLEEKKYKNEIKVDHYDKKLIVKKDDIEYLYNKKTDSYSVYKICGENYELLNTIKNKPVDRIFHHTFSSNHKIKSINIPSNIVKISNSVFAGCLNLKSVTFEPNSKLEIIGRSAFYGTSITHINIPKSCKYIKNGAFAYCLQLRSVTFEGESLLKEIGKSAFINCGSLDGISLPMKLEKIYDKAFYNTCMKYVYIPSSVLYIGEEVFSDISLDKVLLEIDYGGENIPLTWSSSWNRNLIYTIYYSRLPRENIINLGS